MNKSSCQAVCDLTSAKTTRRERFGWEMGLVLLGWVRKRETKRERGGRFGFA